MMQTFATIPVAPGLAGVQATLRAVHELFEEDQSVALVPADNPTALAALNSERPLYSEDPCAVLVTSGSTGSARGVELPLTSLAAAAEFSAVHLGSQAVWLTALPVTGIGGLNTLVRSALAGAEPVIWEGVSGAEKFTATAITPYLQATLRGAQKLRLAAAASLVPTQLHRIADAPATLRLLAEFDYVLVGGSATPPELRERVEAAGVKLVRTYGATETCGGVVYNGAPLQEVRIDFDDDQQILLGSPMNARYYRDGSSIADPWPSGDIGLLQAGLLQVHGRLDDIIKVAGHKLNLATLATSLRGAYPEFGELEIVGSDDPEYGQIPLVVFTGEATEEAVAAAAVASSGLRMPARARQLDEIPLLSNGKPDRRSIARL